jgi:signal transduction histidine kinase
LAIISFGVILPLSRARGAAFSSLRAKHVLFIFGEVRDLPGNALTEQSVREEILHHYDRTEFFYENLDLSHFPDAEHGELFGNYIRSKYAGQKPDLVMVFLGRDFNRVRDLVMAAMPNVPTVFVMHNDMDASEAPPGGWYTTVVQRFDILGTLRFIFQVQPEIRRVVVVGGTSPTDRAVVNRIRGAARSIQGASFEYWTNQPIAHVYARARNLAPDTAILLGTVQSDPSGEPVNTPMVARTLAPAANVPVYVLTDGLIGSGAVGGSVVVFEGLGRRAGSVGALLLGGIPIRQIPADIRFRGVPVADWRALRRWHIPAGRLPPQCEVRYLPHSRWTEHWQLILLLSVGFLAQGITIAALLLQRRGQQRAEAEILRQRAELAHVTRVSMMGQLASALTHELNQPLGAILRNAEAAEVYLSAQPPNLKELQAILTDIRRDDKRAGNVIDRMRSLFKRQPLTSGPIDLGDLVEDTVAMARPDAEARQVRLKLEIPPHLPLAQGDRVHLQQVLLNLILNGMDAMNKLAKSRRSLLIRVEATKNANLKVSVQDRGSGIDPDHAIHIFEPFFTTKSKGMGMGLAISKTIMEAHGGDLWMTSSGVGGTTFSFLLPPSGSNQIKPGDLPPAL